MDNESQGLLDLLVERLDRSGLDEEAQDLVLAAFAGEEEFSEALNGSVEGGRHPEPTVPSPARRASTYITAVTVRGFRGISPERTLALQPGPGLTLVVGRNGSGKSSFAEAAEVALTGTSYRWKGRSAVWQAGWRNLHADDPPTVAVELALDGDRGRTVVSRAWRGSNVDDSEAWVQRPGRPRQPIDSLGWGRDLDLYRPFLSYSELGNMLEGRPSEMHDAVASILGLERLADAEKRLAEARKVLDREAREVEAALRSLLERLAASDDARALQAGDILRKRERDLDAVETLATTQAHDERRDETAALTRLSTLTVPDEYAISDAVHALRATAADVAALGGTDADDARHVAELLERALRHVERHANDRTCPVCGTRDVLDHDWATMTRTEIERLRRTAADAEAAYSTMRRSVQDAGRLIDPLPAHLPADSAAADAWREWWGGSQLDDAGRLADHLETVAPRVRATVDEVRTDARRRLDELEDRWRPLALDLHAWVREGRRVEAERDRRARVKAGYGWLRRTVRDLRNDRLRPIAKESADVWAEMRQESNVELGPVELTGVGTQRRVSLDVTVDGTDSFALGVMSQGELHALALALFLPRATTSESPFRFLVIDDPVQSMDPAKVDGLARVLSRTAQDRQVVVFTHDSRLAEAVGRLQLPATIWEVVRSERSVVEVRPLANPVTRLLSDADGLVKTRELPPDVARRVAPGLCRQALEAALTELARRRHLAAGVRHTEMEDAIADASGLHELAAVAFFGDKQRNGDVLNRVNRYGGWAGDTFRSCSKKGHGPESGDLSALIRDTRRLAGRIRDDR